MSEVFLRLGRTDRADVLGIGAEKTGRPAYLLEKDVWVVCALDALFSAEIGEHLSFKGGTSLSKAYHVIDRFSEDVDVTYDIRELIDIGDASEALPANKSQAKRWAGEVRKRLPDWVATSAYAAIQKYPEHNNIEAVIDVEGENLILNFEPVIESISGYVPPTIRIEFGARSTGEPLNTIPVRCDLTDHFKDLSFPSATPRVLMAERTFWEKATTAHVYTLDGKLRADRFARHWYDLVQLDSAGFGAKAVEDRALADTVARHKQMFFPSKDGDGNEIDYRAAVNGQIHLVPEGAALASLSADYDEMIQAGLLFDLDPPLFDEIMGRCEKLEDLINDSSAAALGHRHGSAG